MKTKIVTLIPIIFSSFTNAHTAFVPCEVGYFNYMQKFDVQRSEMKVLRQNDQIVLTKQGVAYFCESGDQVKNLKADGYLCNVKGEDSSFIKTRVKSEVLKPEHFSNGDGYEYQHIRHIYMCGFVAHRKQTD